MPYLLTSFGLRSHSLTRWQFPCIPPCRVKLRYSSNRELVERPLAQTILYYTDVSALSDESNSVSAIMLSKGCLGVYTWLLSRSDASLFFSPFRRLRSPEPFPLDYLRSSSALYLVPFISFSTCSSSQLEFSSIFLESSSCSICPLSSSKLLSLPFKSFSWELRFLFLFLTPASILRPHPLEPYS